jgi:hypothetical protein
MTSITETEGAAATVELAFRANLGTVADWLVGEGFLAEWDTENQGAVEVALTEYFEP